MIKEKDVAMKMIGVDFGSRMAGTTAICYDDGELRFGQSLKGKDADAFLQEVFENIQPDKIFIDAPLSLPLAYCDKSSTDFFYRECDRAAKAMSPMFLGGLTARAMKLKQKYAGYPMAFYEAYPRGLVDELTKSDENYLLLYKKDIASLALLLSETFDIKIATPPANRHQCDALLAYLIGLRFKRGEHKTFGNAPEGLIYI